MGRAIAFQPPDLTDIIDRAAKDWRWTAAQKKDARLWYFQFLELVYDNPGGSIYILTNEADQLWHTHITFTVRYRAYCESILGFFLEHTPMIGASKATPKVLAAAKDAYTDKGWDITPIKIWSQVPCH